MFALESAMDELSYALDMDPIELRRVNDTQTDPVSGLPFSSRLLMPCFDQAAEKFGWRQRNAEARRDAGRCVAGRLRLRDLVLPQQYGRGRRAHLR